MDILDRIDAAVGCQQCGGELGDSPSDDFCSEVCQRTWRTEHHAEVLVGYREPWQRPEDFPGVGTEAHDTSGERGGFGFGYAAGGWLSPAVVEEVYGWTMLADSFAPARRLYLNTWVAPTPAPGQWCAGEACTEIISRGRTRCPACDLAHRQANWRLPRQTGYLVGDIRACNRARDAATTDAQRAAVRLRTEQLVERSREHWRQFRDAFEGAVRSIGEAAQQCFRDVRAAMGVPEPPERTGDEQRDRMAEALAAQRNRNTGPPSRQRAPRTIGRPTAGRR